ncbi:MAG: aspartate/glutamate racemase family protein [Thiomargarita sp.]|nr:aspartate/glutamate racemase family protein [Thiomargarita sp.]
MKKILGILGGMGPLASAAFLKTIYECNTTDLEQEQPACILYSDPTFPDRTKAIINQSEEDLLIRSLVKTLEKLTQLGASKIVITCITIHHFLPSVPANLRKNIISLIDIIIQEILREKKRYLLLCTNGTRQAGIFQNHSQWFLADEYVILPDEADQSTIHYLIYHLKKSGYQDAINFHLDNLIKKYSVDSLIAGCTEFHLLTKYFMTYKGQNDCIIDPLLAIAKNIRSLMDNANI